MRNVRPLLVFLVALQALIATEASAQSFGTYRWQLAPYCNVLVLSVTAHGGTFTLDGFDDQCGAGQRASVVGTAFPNPDGTLGQGLTIVSTSGGAPVHVEAIMSLATGSGTWHDSAGNAGAYALTANAGTGGSPRPMGGGLGAAAINDSQVQRRVMGTCAQGQAVSAIGQDGSVACQATGGVSGVTSVVAGTGLTGGGNNSAVSLAVNLQQTIEEWFFYVPVSGASQNFITPACEAGRRLTGGGYDLGGSNANLKLFASASYNNGWLVRVLNETGYTAGLTVYKICALMQ